MAGKKCDLTQSQFDALAPELRKVLTERLAGVKPIGVAPSDTDVFDRVVEIDSKLVATHARPLIEKLMGKQFPLKLIKKGGYGSTNEAVEHLIQGLRGWCRADDHPQLEQQESAQ